jgi:hypothetical protein
VVLCGCAAIAGITFFRYTGNQIEETLNQGPAEVKRVGEEIAAYDVPDDFTEAYSTSIAGYTMIGYNSTDGHSHIFFFQMPEGVTIEGDSLREKFNEAFPTTTTSAGKTVVVETKTGTIRGQEVTLVVIEGTNGEGQPYREISAAFEGNGGQAMVIFSRPVSAWDQAEVDDFLAGIQ